MALISNPGDDDAFLPNVQEESVVEGHKLFLDKNTEVIKEEYRKADAIKQKLAMDITHLEFERMPEVDNKKGRGWRHKQTGRTFLQYKSSNNNSWDTGVFNKQLKLIMHLRLKGQGPAPSNR